jgi:hypothetical protein
MKGGGPLHLAGQTNMYIGCSPIARHQNASKSHKIYEIATQKEKRNYMLVALYCLPET